MPELIDVDAEYLRTRGVSDDVARERGYYSVGCAADLPDGPHWSSEQAAHVGRVGALAIPMYGPETDIPLIFQIRPRFPRVSVTEGGARDIKFDIPPNVRRGAQVGELPADVHPSVVPLLYAESVWEVLSPVACDRWAERDVFDEETLDVWAEDPARTEAELREASVLQGPKTVIITEGVVKGDAILSAARREGIETIIPVSVTGVDMAVDADKGGLVDSLSWMTTEFEVVIAFDADFASNRSVSGAIGRLRDALESRGHRPAMIDLSPYRSGEKDGIDDVLASGVTVSKLLSGALSVHHYVPYPGRMIGERRDDIAIEPDGSHEAVACRVALAITDGEVDKAARWDATTREWLAFDGIRWSKEGGETRVRSTARDISEQMVQLVLSGGPPSEARKNAKSLRSAGHRDGSLKLTRDYPGVVARTETWDANPAELTTPSGIVNLADGSVRKTTPADEVTLTTGVAYRPDARSSLWESFLADTFGHDDETIRWMQLVAGACATGYVIEQLFWLVGRGGDGKSTWTGALEYALGDYAVALDPDWLLRPSASSSDSARAQLRGRRYLRLAEANADLEASLVKRVTSTDRITARPLYCPPMSFDPTHTAIVTSNRYPSIRRVDADRGTFRRLTIVPFEHSIGTSDMDLTLGQRLREPDHAEAILAWVVRGAVDFIASDLALVPCPAVAAATARVLEDADVIGEWIADHLVPDLNGRISQKVLAEACHTWLFDQGRQGKESNAEIARRIEAHVPAAAAKRSNGDRLVVGIAWNARGQKLARRSVRRSVDIGTVVQQDPPVQEVEEPF